MATETLEERLQVLEQKVAQMQTLLSGDRPGVIGRTSPDFLEKYTGVFANDPLFDEMIRGIEEERERERWEARGEGDVEDAPT